MVYDPAETRFLKLAKERGAQVIPGIEMFVHQAARQFEIWTGKPAPWDEMLRVVLLAQQERVNRSQPGNQGQTMPSIAKKKLHFYKVPKVRCIRERDC